MFTEPLFLTVKKEVKDYTFHAFGTQGEEI
jgi:hypothetical protein